MTTPVQKDESLQKDLTDMKLDDSKPTEVDTFDKSTENSKVDDTATSSSKKSKSAKKREAKKTKSVLSEVVNEAETKKEEDEEEEEDNAAGADSDEVTCAFCHKASNPTKRCGKRHPKCIRKMFCNATCEELAHKETKKPASGSTGSAKETTKKKTNRGRGGKKENDAGKFWWNSNVYASW